MIEQGPTYSLRTTPDYSAEIRARLDALTAELSSGRRSDVGRAVSSDFSPISKIAHDLHTHDAKRAVLVQASTWLEITQSSLASIQESGVRIFDEMPVSLAIAGSAGLENLALTARGALEDMVGALGSLHGGRSVFANGDPRLGNPIEIETLLVETRNLARDATNLENLFAVFDEYFNPSIPDTGVEANAIRSYRSEPVAFPTGEGRSLSIKVSVADVGVREALKSAALIAALPAAGFALTEDIKSRLGLELPRRSIKAMVELVSSRGRVGSLEERVDRLRSRLDSERLALEGRQSEIIASDPYETAIRLQSEMTRLESVFSVTARRARLKLTDFIR